VGGLGFVYHVLPRTHVLSREGTDHPPAVQAHEYRAELNSDPSRVDSTRRTARGSHGLGRGLRGFRTTARVTDMSHAVRVTERTKKMDSIGPALEHWKQRLRELPDVRLDKVQSVRSALQQSSYESERVLESTVQRLSNDVGVLCRKDSSADSA
jgi:hypothetical protein